MKLGEEAAEVAQATFKVMHFDDRKSRKRLEGEIADVLAIVRLMAAEPFGLDMKRIQKLVKKRMERERKRMA
jgi:NTP pyrophosphatase (non-canonical NTP hydrolase)